MPQPCFLAGDWWLRRLLASHFECFRPGSRRGAITPLRSANNHIPASPDRGRPSACTIQKKKRGNYSRPWCDKRAVSIVMQRLLPASRSCGLPRCVGPAWQTVGGHGFRCQVEAGTRIANSIYFYDRSSCSSSISAQRLTSHSSSPIPRSGTLALQLTHSLCAFFSPGRV